MAISADVSSLAAAALARYDIELPPRFDLAKQIALLIESVGLFYSYRADDPKYPGRVAFIPALGRPMHTSPS